MFAHHQKGAVDFQVIKTWAPWLILGCCIGTYVASFTDAKGLYLIFAWGGLLYGIYFLYPQILEKVALKKRSMPSGFARASLVSCLGGISSLLGIAGGTVTVITMSVCQRPIYEAVATASGVGLIIGSVGALGFLLIGINETNLPFGSIGYINFPALLIISILSVLTAPYGVRWAHSLDESKLKKFFGFYLLLVSAGMFFKANLTVAEI